MNEWHERMDSGSEILRQQAVRIPLPDMDAERSVHDNMMRIAAAGERKSTLLNDPDMPVTEVYEDELAEMRQSFQHRLQQLVGEDYYEIATAYLDGGRDDWIGALAAYYLDCYYHLQERYTVDEHIFFLLILRYPACITINLSFLTGNISADGVRYESATHAESDLDESHHGQFYADCQYSQHEAADYLERNTDCIRDAFPDPETTSFSQRQHGGFVHITGRRGTTFAEILDSVSPDPDRFDDEVSTPGLVAEGPEAKRVKAEFVTDAEVIL